jgi:lipopolysaccharide transport system ATP-binding protein
MASISLKSVSVSFPIYGASAHSIKKTLAASVTGGRIGKDSGIVVVSALRNINLELRDGDRLGILGHNGAGKSTLLRTLAGIYRPTTGSIFVEGKIASLLEPTLGMDQDATGLENIKLRGLLMGVSKKEIESITPEISSFSGLGDYLFMPVRTYSTGMLLRLAFSITTAIKADIFLMDEWLSVGDASFAAKAEERMKKFLNKSGILALASHSKELIQRECNKIIELSHGEITYQENI